MLTEIKKNEKGFTLVELIVVIAIMAVLAALLIPRIMGNVEDARHQKEVTTAQTIASEITIWNAKANASTTDTINPIPAGPVTAMPTVLTALPTGNFPLATDVTINVDADGNASITEIVPTP